MAPRWSFLTNHAYVLRHLTQEPPPTLVKIAHAVGITERAVQRIVAELEGAGYLKRERDGRRNRYVITEGEPRRPVDQALPMRELLGLVPLVSPDEISPPSDR